MKPILPLVLHNVFLWAERDHLDGQIKDRKGKDPSLYWFLQTVGMDRVLEDVIRAVGQMKQPTQIHLRGTVSERDKRELFGLASQYGVNQLYFHQRVSSGELISRTAEHDVGLALEQPVSLNKRLTVANKLFFYLTAGLAVAAADLPGQRYVMDSCPGTGFLNPPGDPAALARSLEAMLNPSSRLEAAKKASLMTAQNEWKWEKESQKLIKQVLNLLT